MVRGFLTSPGTCYTKQKYLLHEAKVPVMPIYGKKVFEI